MNTISERQRVRFYIIQKAKKSEKHFFILQKNQTLYKNKDNLRYVLYKMLDISHENF